MEQIFRAKIDSEAESWYPPFLMLGLALFAGAMLLMCGAAFDNVTSLMVKIWFACFVGVVIFDCVLIRFLFPHDHIELLYSKRLLFLDVYRNKEMEKQIQIGSLDFWWGYANMSNIKSDGMDEFGMDNNSSLKGKGYTNTNFLFVEISDNAGTKILLKEHAYLWDGNPEWEYATREVKSSVEVVPCFHLEKFMKSYLEYKQFVR